MDQALKQRLVGAVVLIALAVIFLPVFISGPQDDDAIAERQQILVPPAPDSRLSSKRLPVIDDGASLSPDAAEDTPQWPIEANPAAAADSIAETLPEPAPSHTDSVDQASTQLASDDNSPAGANDSMQSDADISATAASDAAVPAADQTAASSDDAATGSGSETLADAATETAQVQLSATAPDPAQWHVQVASLGNPDNVRRLQQQLQSMSLRTITERIQRDDTTLYRVVTGPYADESAAQQVLDRIVAADQRLRPVLMEPEGYLATDDVDDTAAATPSGLDRYAVQVGVFSSRERSDEVVASLQNAGFAAYQESIERTDETWYRVRIGPLLSEQDGNNIAARIKRDLELDSMVVDYR